MLGVEVLGDEGLLVHHCLSSQLNRSVEKRVRWTDERERVGPTVHLLAAEEDEGRIRRKREKAPPLSLSHRHQVEGWS